MTWPLDETISAGQAGHISDHQDIHTRLNDLVLAETWAFEGNLAVAVGLIAWASPFPATIVEVVARVGTAATGSSVIFDVNKAGTTIYTTQANRPTIAAGSTAVATAGAAQVTALAKNDLVTVDVDQVGSTTPGASGIVQLRYIPS